MTKSILTISTGVIAIYAAPLSAQVTDITGPDVAAPLNVHQSVAFGQTNAPEGIWSPEGIGEGFRPHLQEVGVSVGAGGATHEIGGKVSHDLLLSRFYYGHMLGERVGRNKWYEGNWEFMQEFFGGWQYDPADRYLLGTTSLLRYNLATGTRLVPFLHAGVGFSLTNIGHPDLGSPGEFNGQIGPGINYFWRDNVAFTLQYRYMHNSNGGIKSPNQGVNENIGYVGVSWFF